jgi:2,4-didehydro-3-deoxy-L-rhamnonate hydrolase
MAKFTLATLNTKNGARAAIGVGDGYYLLGLAQPLLRDLTVRRILETWETSLPVLEALSSELSAGKVNATKIAAASADLLTPVRYPDALLAVGANYSGHLKEMGLQVTKWASMPFFLRPPITTLVGPGETVRLPRTTKQFDWECELAVFVSKRLRHANREEAASAVAGYAIGLDLSCRDLIPANNDLKIDLVRGKAQDTMAPCGPHIMPAMFVTDVNNLRIQLSVNGRPMMDASTCEMLYKIDEQLSIISEYLTLEPGDILFTGSPAGSAGQHGGCWLKAGDRIHAEIEEVGTLDVTVRSDN